MPPIITTTRHALYPLTDSDEACVAQLLMHADIARHLGDQTASPSSTARAIIADSRDPATVSRFWRIGSVDAPCIGIAGLRPPQVTVGRLRNIGWRSLEMVLALAPGARRQGTAGEIVEALVANALADGVTFAVLGVVSSADEATQRLMARSRFHELDRIHEQGCDLVVYERSC